MCGGALYIGNFYEGAIIYYYRRCLPTVRIPGVSTRSPAVYFCTFTSFTFFAFLPPPPHYARSRPASSSFIAML
jgi:hypothetical protein